MAPRFTRRTRKRDQQLEQTALIEKFQLDQLRADFPRELEQICNLEPWRSKPHLVDDLLLKLDKIVGLARRRLDKQQEASVVQAIRSSNVAAANIAQMIDGLAKMDIEQLQTVLVIARGISPKPFEKRDVSASLRLLHDLQTLMLTLHSAIEWGTGIFDLPKGKGRPSSPYVQPALELIEVWESLTATPYWEDSRVALIKRVPTPKRLEVSGPRGKDPRYLTKQPSTEFILIALRMINPNIKNAEVFTAIKKALAERDELLVFVRRKLRRKPPKSLPGLIKAVLKHAP
jgi:hypothetical protein